MVILIAIILFRDIKCMHGNCYQAPTHSQFPMLLVYICADSLQMFILTNPKMQPTESDFVFITT